MSIEKKVFLVNFQIDINGSFKMESHFFMNILNCDCIYSVQHLWSVWSKVNLRPTYVFHIYCYYCIRNKAVRNNNILFWLNM